MIGKIYRALTPYFDTTAKKNTFKGRPCLVIAQADKDDYVLLPVSTITHKHNVDPNYDIPIDPAVYPKTNLKNFSYVRTHKQTVLHKALLQGVLCDLKTEYEDVYLEILQKREEFSQNITNQALK